MSGFSRSITLIAALSVAPSFAALAQNNNPGNSAGVNAPLATPTYESGDSTNPALTTGRLPSGATAVPRDENPNVRGATGETIVKGDRSTISSDRRATAGQKSGEGEEGGGN